MYCKYCGKELKEGARFCDRCGQSVRKAKESTQAAKHREIEELKAERLNRKKRLKEKEARQQERKEKKRRKKRGGGVLIFLIIIILIAVLSVIVGYNIFPSGTETNNSAKETSAPATSVNEVTMAPSSTASAEKYSQITVGNISIPYPSDFYTNTASGNTKLNVVDSLGGASMVVAQEARNGEITELIKEYITSIGASDANGGPDMRAGSDWYGVTATVDGKVYHRKCIVRNGLAVYYDFTYDEASTSAKKYEDYIKYIDSNFK